MEPGQALKTAISQICVKAECTNPKHDFGYVGKSHYCWDCLCRQWDNEAPLVIRRNNRNATDAA